MRILYLQATCVPPATDQRADRFSLLPDTLEGDILQPAWFERPDQIEALYGPGSYPIYTVGGFRYHWFLTYANGRPKPKLTWFWFYLRKGVELHRARQYECVVVYSHMTTALTAIVLRILTGAKLIVEIVTAPELIYLTNRRRPGLIDRVRHFYSDACLHLAALFSERMHCLFPGQLGRYQSLRRIRRSVFHDFTPISMVRRHDFDVETDSYVLMIGAPWYLKGADVLVEAFRSIASEFPDVKLKIVGHNPDAAELIERAAGFPQIEILKATMHSETLKLISAASVLVLPSRCEGLPRVLIEGMAAGLPLIGSSVGGIPTLIHDGENGFVVPPNDAVLLAKQLRKTLSDPALRRRFGERSFERGHREFSEAVYAGEFAKMIEQTLRPDASRKPDTAPSCVPGGS